MSKKVKILVSYHKPDVIFRSDCVLPIHVGRVLYKKKADKNGEQESALFMKETIGDDTGENISTKNPYYNEMTGIYWAWKNFDALGDPDYIGFMHYRRHLCLKKLNDKVAFFERNEIDDPSNYVENELGLNAEEINEIFCSYDAIVSTPYYKESVYKHYLESHDIGQLEQVTEIVKKNYPKYYASYKKYLSGHSAYFCNMFIFPKDIFFEYCEFVFGVLSSYERSPIFDGGRLFVSERLTGAFIQYLIDKKKKIATAPTVFFEERTVIPVAFATDKNFIAPTSVALYSMLKSAKSSTYYKIFIMSPEESVEEIKEAMSFLKEKFRNYELNVIDMGRRFDDIKMTIKHITPQTYYRLKLPEILAEYNKCLYLDSDVIIEKDLAQLYRNYIEDHYVAGVRAAGYYYPPEWVEKHANEVGLPDMSRYINAGVLLMNLKKIREDGVDKKMLSLVGKGFPSQDQDIVNLVCYEKIKILPVRYNLMTKYVKKENGRLFFDKCDEEVFGQAECIDALKNPVVIHYADKIKPWQNREAVFFDRWQKYAEGVPFFRAREKKKISVIIPVYNMEKYLDECLRSVFCQTMKDVEVICVNDGSTDGSAEILKRYRKERDNLFVIDQNNHGVAYARNVALDYASSEFVCFMDPDDFYPDCDVLETLYRAAKEHNVKIAGGSWKEMIYSPDGSVSYKDDFTGTLNWGYTFSEDKIMTYTDYQFDFGYHRFIYDTQMLKDGNVRFPYYVRFQDPPFFVKAMLCAKEFYAMKKQTYCYRLGYQTQSIYRGQKLIDFTLGVIDMLRISRRNGLARLHQISLERMNRITNEYVDRAAQGDQPYLFELLIRANTALDRGLLKKIRPEINENYLIPPLQKVVSYFTTAANENRISSPDGGLLKRGWRYLKKYGIKCTLIRLFKGRKEADKYKNKKRR